jgi:hypothetical protein
VVSVLLDGIVDLWVLVVALVVLAMATMIVTFAWSMRQFRRFNPDNNQAMAAMQRGDHERAAAVFERWTTGGNAATRALARHNLAWTRLRQGRLAEASELFVANEADPRALSANGLYTTTEHCLALCFALAGDLKRADSRMKEAALREPDRTNSEVMRSFARAVIDCRRGQPADAARDLEDHWNAFEQATAGDVLRPLRIVRAFAAAAAGPREAARVHALLARPAYPGEYDFLAASWPELADFLATHDLGGAPAVTAPAADRP